MCAVPNSAVFCTTHIEIFGANSFRKSFSPLLTVPNAPITIGIVVTLRRFQHFCTSISKSLYFVSFSASFLIILLHTGIDTSINVHTLSFVSCIVISGRLHPTFFPVKIALSHITMMLLCCVTSSGICFIQHLSTFIPIFFKIHQCTCLPT